MSRAASRPSPLAEFAEVMTLSHDGPDVYVGSGGFPKVIEATTRLLDDSPQIARAPGQVTFWLKNGHATYRVAEVHRARGTEVLVRLDPKEDG